MLTPQQRELLHREIDGENTPEESVEVRMLVETRPEALALMTSLRDLDALFREVPDRDPPAHLRHRIHQAMSRNAGQLQAAGIERGATETITSWLVQQWQGIINLTGEIMSTKKILIVATTVVAVIAIIGQTLVGYPPSVFDAGSIGARDSIAGVQKAGRYRQRTETDVTLSNPQISALFQNDQVLKLVKSEVFREALHNEAFRELQSNEAFHQLLASETYHELLSSESYHELLASEKYREQLASENYRELLKGESYRVLLSSEAYRELLANDSFRLLLANESYRELLANDSFRLLLSSDVFNQVMANDKFRELFALDAYRVLGTSEAFRAISRTQSLSEAFLTEAARVVSRVDAGK